MTHPAPHVTLANVSHSYRERGREHPALEGIDLEVSWGEFVAVLGPSGCGKSTLLRLVGGLIAPTRGRVLLGEGSPQEAQRHKEIGFVFQQPALLPWRTVWGNVALSLEVNGNGSAPGVRVAELLEMVGLQAFRERYPHQLSGGMQQRVALARALAHDPPLLLMDEPFGALDAITRDRMGYELLRLWERSRKTVLFVTHSIAESITLSDRVVVLTGRPGRIKASVPIPLPRPRGEQVVQDRAFHACAQALRQLLWED